MCLCSCTPCEGIHAQVTSQRGGAAERVTIYALKLVHVARSIGGCRNSNLSSKTAVRCVGCACEKATQFDRLPWTLSLP